MPSVVWGRKKEREKVRKEESEKVSEERERVVCVCVLCRHETVTGEWINTQLKQMQTKKTNKESRQQ